MLNKSHYLIYTFIVFVSKKYIQDLELEFVTLNLTNQNFITLFFFLY